MFGARLFANRDEFRQIMRESSSGLTTTERSLIDRILDLQGLTVGDLARPMRDVICVEADTPLRLVVGLCEKHELSRLPVWLTESGKRRIGGIVSLRSILYGDSTHWDEPAKSMLSPALYFEGGLPLEEARSRSSTSMRAAVRGGPRCCQVAGRFCTRA